MSALFGGLTTDGLEETQDRLGGFQAYETDIYTGVIKAAYAGQSSGGAKSVTVLVDLGGKEYRETEWITDKEGKNYFLNKNDKTKKVALPGFTIIDDICLIATGLPLSEQGAEEKVLNIYDAEQKKEVPKSVQVLTGLTGKPIALGILKVLENKSELRGTEYVDIPDTRDTNTIDKVFHPELKLTVAEARNGAAEPIFWNSWLDRNKGNTRDKRTIKDGANTGRAGAPQAGQTPAKKSLFGN